MKFLLAFASQALGGLPLTAFLVFQALSGFALASCPADNCFNALQNNKASAVPYCESLLSTPNAAPTLPTYLSNCGAGSTVYSRLSTLCPCLLSTTTATTTSSAILGSTTSCGLATATITQMVTVGGGGSSSCYETSACALWATFTACGPLGSSSSGGSCPPPSTVTSSTTVTAGGATVTISTGGTTVTTTVSTTVSSVASQPTCNNVVNGGFETGDLTGWTRLDAEFFSAELGIGGENAPGQVLIATNPLLLTSVYSGSYSWAFGSSDFKYFGLQQTLSLCSVAPLFSPPTLVPLTLTAQIRTGTGSGTCTATLGVYGEGGPGGVTQQQVTPTSNIGSWSLLSVPFGYNGTPDEITIYFYGTCTGADYMYVDNVQIQ